MDSTETKRAYRRSIFDALCVAVLIAYFLHFALPALRGGFREDEMMNMGICWCAGALKSFLANIVFWKLFLCPGDALYYLSIYLLPIRGDAPVYPLLFGCLSACVILDLICFFNYAPDPRDD